MFMVQRGLFSVAGRYVAVTRVCVATTISGVPLGTHVAWLSSRSSGWPLLVTRVTAT